jgi:integrase
VTDNTQNTELAMVFADRLEYPNRQLSAFTLDILAARREPSTLATYRREWQRFCDWSTEQKIFDYPVTAYTAGAYLTWLHGTGLSRSTIRKAITVLGLAHDGSANPCSERMVREIIKGIMRRDRRPVKKARPLALAELVAICDQLTEIGDSRALRDRALLSVGWMAALRSAEIAGLNWGDVVEVEAGIELQIRESKTNKTGEAEIIGLPLLHEAYQIVCPVRNLRAIMPAFECSDTPLEPVFARYPATLFDIALPGRISTRLVQRAVTRGANLARLEQHYSSHCLRRGFATYAASRGVSELTIMRHGRWKSSAVAQGYIERAKIWSDNPIRELLGQNEQIT